MKTDTNKEKKINQLIKNLKYYNDSLRKLIVEELGIEINKGSDANPNTIDTLGKISNNIDNVKFIYNLIEEEIGK